MLILGIDTTDNIGLALTQDEKVIAETVNRDVKSEHLLSYIDHLFTLTEFKIEAVEAIGVVTGPGGYTSIRSGISVAKTLAQFINIPLIGHHKVDLMLSAMADNILTAPLVDVKRNEVYTGIGYTKNKQIIYETEPKLFTLEELKNLLTGLNKEANLLAGDFADKRDIFNNFPENIQVDFNYRLKPSIINKCTREHIEQGKITYFNDVSPFYTRDFFS